MTFLKFDLFVSVYFNKAAKYLTDKKLFSQSKSLAQMKSFETLKFDNRTLRVLPIDPITENYVREVKDACFSKVYITDIFLL